jgi:hypothetical protein
VIAVTTTVRATPPPEMVKVAPPLGRPSASMSSVTGLAKVSPGSRFTWYDARVAGSTTGAALQGGVALGVTQLTE